MAKPFYIRALLVGVIGVIACTAQTWTLRSGPVEYRLGVRDGAVLLDYFGPAGGPSWKPGTRQDIAGTVDGHRIRASDLSLVSHESSGASDLTLRYRYAYAPLEIGVHYAAMGDTGVITRQIALSNTGTAPLHITMSSLALTLPPGAYELNYVHGHWSGERQLVTERAGPAQRTAEVRLGRSGDGSSPWFSLRNDDLGVRYMGQLAYSGNWDLRFARQTSAQQTDAGDFDVDLGMHFDTGGVLTLAAGQRFELPGAAMTATSGDMDDAANQLHRYQRRFVVPAQPANRPPLVQFNTWYAYGEKLHLPELKRAVDAAAEVGAEVFVVDSGWYSAQGWVRSLGDYEVDPAVFPGGIGEFSAYVHSKGMKFGLWTEIEDVGDQSNMFRQHADWCLGNHGKPVIEFSRCNLDFARPEVRRWARGVVDRMMKEAPLDWIKIDYNIRVGDEFDGSGGDRLYRHLLAYYGWLDELRAAYPKLIVENCASGGMRFDLGIMAHTHATWLSDEVRPLPSLQLGYACTLEFMPEVCNHWMVGENDHADMNMSADPGWWDFLFRVPMNGQWGMSSRIADWSPQLRRRAADNVTLYKRLRGTIGGADVYHLTPEPDHDAPADWMAIEYVSPDRTRALIMAYRLGQSADWKTLRLRGLDPEGSYRVIEDGADAGVRTGRELAAGLPVHAPAEWRSSVIELVAAARP